MLINIAPYSIFNGSLKISRFQRMQQYQQNAKNIRWDVCFLRHLSIMLCFFCRKRTKQYKGTVIHIAVSLYCFDVYGIRLPAMAAYRSISTRY